MTAESSPPASSDKNYIAIIGDLRHSRRVKDRAELQRRLIAAVDELNHRLAGSGALAARIALTAGDEAQALLTESDPVVDILDTLSTAARPASFTFGLGFGPLTTDITENVALIDGPAFHNARAALDSARSDGAWAAAQGFGPDDSLLSSLLALMGAARERWTDRQIEFMSQVRGASQIEVARAEGVSPSVVSESLKSAAYVPYYSGESALNEILARHLEAEAS